MDVVLISGQNASLTERGEVAEPREARYTLDILLFLRNLHVFMLLSLPNLLL